MKTEDKVPWINIIIGHRKAASTPCDASKMYGSIRLVKKFIAVYIPIHSFLYLLG